RWQRQLLAPTADFPQDGVHERSGAAFARASRKADRVVDGSRRGDAIELQKLEDREPQDVQDLGIQPGDRPSRDVADDAIESTLPTEGAGCDLAGQRAIALVLQVRTRRGERMRQVRAAAVHGAENLVGRLAGRRDHAGSMRAPASTGWPL